MYDFSFSVNFNLLTFIFFNVLIKIMGITVCVLYSFMKNHISVNISDVQPVAKMLYLCTFLFIYGLHQAVQRRALRSLSWRPFKGFLLLAFFKIKFSLKECVI